MVTVETRVQLAIKEILIEEIEKHLNTGDNFDVVLSIASLIDPYEEEPDPCEPYKETCDRVGMCIGCYDGYKNPIGWQAFYNLLNKAPFRYLTTHELTYLTCAWNKEVHTCDEWCSKFFSYKYVGETCGIKECNNLFIKERKNMKYCTYCRKTPGVIYRQNYYKNYKCSDKFECKCKNLP